MTTAGRAGLRPCRPCTALAIIAARWGWTSPPIEAAALDVTWPPESISYIYPQCRPTAVATCPWHRRWTLWPIALHTALSIEAEDMSMPKVAAESSIEAALRRKREQDMGGRVAKRHGWGSLPGQSVKTLIDAYLEAGTYGGAARLLNARKVRTWKGGPWSSVSVSSMIRGYPAVNERSHL